MRETARNWVEEGGIAIADRFDLLEVEFKLQFKAAIGILFVTALAFFLVFGVLMFASVVVLLQWFDTSYWGTAVLLTGGVWLLLLLFAVLSIRRMAKRLSRPFVLTRQVLAQDFHDLKERL